MIYDFFNLSHLFEKFENWENDYKIPELDIIFSFFPLLSFDFNEQLSYEENQKKFISEFDKLIGSLEILIPDKITDKAKMDLSILICEYIETEPETENRIEVMKKLFTLKWLKNEK